MQAAYRRNLPTRKGGTALLLIDPQVDFHTGSLGIPASAGDAARIARVLRNVEIQEVYVTLDTHQRYHIAHPLFWRDAEGRPPKPFTVISTEALEEGKWSPADKAPETAEWCAHYLSALEEQGRFQLTIWPEHCLVGSPGGSVEPGIAAALAAWEEQNVSAVQYFRKGANSLTEHYSAFKAEVPRPDDPSTGLNTALVEALKQHDEVLICGQALSHCVGTSTEDLAALWDPAALDRLVLLADCTSPVPGFEAQGRAFLDQFRAQGLSVREMYGREAAESRMSMPKAGVVQRMLTQLRSGKRLSVVSRRSTARSAKKEQGGRSTEESTTE